MTLTPLAAALKYTATPAFRSLAEMTAYYAPYTAFRSAAVPGAMASFSTPKRFLERAWRKADPSVPPWNTDINGYCPQTVSICDLPVRESGIFWAKERVNGVEREDSVAINCSVGDSLMDFPAGRKAFMDALDSAKVHSEWWQRKERAFAIIEVINQPGQFEIVWLPDPAGDMCHMDLTMLTPTLIPGRKVRAYVHIHPFEPFVPGVCLDSAGNPFTGPVDHGMSPDDSVTMYNFNKYITDSLTGSGWAPVPFYVMDPTWIYRQPPGEPFVDFSKDMSKALDWSVGGRCKWVRPTLSQAPIMQVINKPIHFTRQLPAISP